MRIKKYLIWSLITVAYVIAWTIDLVCLRAAFLAEELFWTLILSAVALSLVVVPFARYEPHRGWGD